MFSTNFSGKIYQVIEALDYGDAVSNQALALDEMFKAMNLESYIYSKWHHAKLSQRRLNLEDMAPTEHDIVIFHFVGFSKFSLPYILKNRCTKVCIYHNITPQSFFPPKSPLYEFCRQGRMQLEEIVATFDYFWGDSAFNLEEIIALGGDPARCAVIPIIVDGAPAERQAASSVRRAQGSWLFVGRIVANKGQIELVKLFASVRQSDGDLAQKLYLVGNFSDADPYYQDLLDEIDRLSLAPYVSILGKVSDEEVDHYLSSCAVYVSLSKHEGFGVPLIEAALHGLPVVALDNTAIGETLGGKGLGDTFDAVRDLVAEVLSDQAVYDELVEAQKINSARFKPQVVRYNTEAALKEILPDRHRFSTVSVVICTYNRCDLLERCLDYLQYQTNQNFEVVVVNGPSTDRTLEVLEQYADRIKIVQNPERNLSKSRNLGIEAADGDLIAFIDDDALPFDDWVDTLIREFSSRPLKTAAIGGPAYYSGTLKYQVQDIAINKLAEARVDVDASIIGHEGWERSMLGTNTCFRADAVREILGFDEQFDYFLDESELSFRLQKAGYIVGYSPVLYLRHEFAQSANRQGKHKFNWFTICKNTAYYICAYSGMDAETVVSYLDDRIYKERIAPLEAAHRSGELSLADLKAFTKDIKRGVEQGIRDAKRFPRTRRLKSSPGLFKPYTVATRAPLIGRDLYPLHICILTKEFPPFAPGGGIGTLYYHLASELLLMGHQVTVVTPGDVDNVFQQGRFAIHYVSSSEVFEDGIGAPGFTNNMNWSVSAMNAIGKIHANNPIDVVDSALWDSEALALALLPPKQRMPLVVRLVTPFPVAARINNWAMPARAAEFFMEAERALIEHADVVVPISDSIAATIEKEHKIHRDSRWHRSYCGIAYWPSFDHQSGYAELTSVNGRPYEMPAGAKIILFVGRLETRKGVDLVLSAAEEFLKADENAHLVFAGSDVEGWSKRQMSGPANAYSSRIHFLGAVDDPTREKLLSMAYCVLFPSRYESFGLVPLEAFVHGVPVIASASGAIPEVVADNVCGLLFDADDAQSLAKCVVRLLGEAKLREKLSSGARFQSRRFGSRQSAIDTLKLYQDLLPKEKLLEVMYRPSVRMKLKDGLSNQSFSYRANSPSLKTQVGQLDGNYIRSKSLAGFLIYGPYVSLPAGRYKATLHGSVALVGETRAYVEVVGNSNPDPLKKVELAPHVSGVISSLDFDLPFETIIEVRVKVFDDSDVAIQKLVILQEKIDS